MADFEHLLLTRFNVRHGPWRADKRGNAVLTDAWLEHRFDLFERYCFPSVAAQTCRDFQWLVFFDEATPEKQRRRLDRYRELASFRPEFVTEDTLLDVVRERAAGASTLITTRLDNDDAIHRETIARVQAHLPVNRLELVNFLVGYFVARDRIVRVEHPSNMFISMIEPAGSEPFRTVWCSEHPQLGRLGPIHQVSDVPGWISVIHDRNLSNEIRDAPGGAGAALRAAAGRLLRAVGMRREEPAAAAAPKQFASDATLAELAESFGLDPETV
jgi:hypothetical protein